MSRPRYQPRAVIDTNLVLSALVFAQGRLAPLRHAWQSGRCQPLVSGFTVTELLRVLAYPKFKLTTGEQQELLSDYLPYCTTVQMPVRLPAIPACRDVNDLAFLHLAIVGKADVLVSGDNDLLSLAGQFARPILTAGQFMGRLK